MALNRGNVSDKPASSAAAEATMTPAFNPAEFAPPGTQAPVSAGPATDQVPAATDAGNDAQGELVDDSPEEVAGGTAMVTDSAAGNRGMVTTSNRIVDQLAENGMEGMDMGFGAFPQVVLGTDGLFSSQEFGDMGKEFDCIIMQSKNKFICKNGLPDNNPEVDFFYSYYSPNKNNHLPQVTTTGKPIADILTQWKIKGWTPEWKTYLDVMAQIVGGDHDGTFVMLSIPQTSITRLSGYLVTQQAAKGLRQDEYVTKCRVGAKVTSGTFPFYPWKFEFAGEREAEAA